MAFHLIVTCVAQKKAKKVHSILDSAIESGSLEHVFAQWNNMLSNSQLTHKKAVNLYKGALWNSYLDGWGVINNREKDANLWILSAGYGLINAEEEILPYDITFQEPRNGSPSIQAKVLGSNETYTRRNIIQGWWNLLSKSNNREPASLKSLIESSNKDDYFLIVLGKDYLDAIFEDLQKAIQVSKNPKYIAVVSNNVDDPFAKRLKPNWLYADSRFVNLPDCNNTVVNAKIAKELIWYMFHEKSGLSWWSHENFNAYLKKLSSKLPEPKRPIREPRTDDQVQTFIIESLRLQNTPFTKLHREYRDSGRACEYNRFKTLYYKVKDDLKKIALRERPKLPVNYTKRNTKMLFFIPDWDDRVDPLFDFKNDIPTPNRDPYEHDAYHYELYGTLNCDGILVSKSVLEDNSKKKATVSKIGIHQYLRLPANVPVLGDCGAFNYISEENPPYETDEILDYYENLGFNFGVSIDHLIVPGVLKRTRYYQFQSNDWVKISDAEFSELKELPSTKIIKSRNRYKQLGIFKEENILVEENYIDEKERQRRYELTINNARQFIKAHSKRKYSFIPIGAAQGWDPDSYASTVKEYQKMGYSYIALGGLVKSKTSDIIEILNEISKIKKPETKLHLFGVARLDAIESFLKLGVYSVDSAGMLRQAWLSSSSNYYSPDLNHYSAIRIPPSDKSTVAKKAVQDGIVSHDKLLSMENKCLLSLREFDKGNVSLDDILKILMAYGEITGLDGNLRKSYMRTLFEKPWQKCPCKLCKATGIDIMIFRRNNRNRRRGFHNTWLFFNKFKELTNI